MKKLTKSTLAVAAGIALLMGGAGTLAVWNDTISAGASGVIAAGTLQLSDASAGVWTDQNDQVIDVASFSIVPGDTLTYTTDVSLTAIGDNLTGTIGLGQGSIVAATAAPEDAALAALLTNTAEFTVDGVAGDTFAATGATQTMEITVTITWPSGTPGEDNPAQLGQVSLTDFAITATQA